MSIIYNLDHHDCTEEIAYMSNMGQFTSPDNYVNTGFTNAVSYDEEDEDKTFVVHKIIVTNELNNLCFTMEECNYTYKEEDDDERYQNKVVVQLYKTYSELDLFQLNSINQAL